MGCSLKSKIKAIVKKILGASGLKKINYARNYRLLVANSIKDFRLYLKHSTVFNQDGLHKNRMPINS